MRNAGRMNASHVAHRGRFDAADNRRGVAGHDALDARGLGEAFQLGEQARQEEGRQMVFGFLERKDRQGRSSSELRLEWRSGTAGHLAFEIEPQIEQRLYQREVEQGSLAVAELFDPHRLPRRGRV